MIIDKQTINLLLVIVFFMITSLSLAQTSDLLRLEYLNIPNSNSKNRIERFRAFFQLPLKINEKNYFVVSGDYRTIHLDLKNVPFSKSDLSSVQRIDATLGYIYKTEGEWIYAGNAGVRLASNFHGKMVSDDYIYQASFYAIRDRKNNVKSGGKPNRLVLGLNYSTTPGRSFPLPIINYYREFHPNWTYTLGVPKTNLRYKINKTNHIQFFVTLDNFFANIQSNKNVNGKLAENISMTTVLSGLGYEYYFTDHLLYYAYAAYTISNDFRLRDNQRNDIFTIENTPSMYLRTGIKFKI